MNYDHAYHAGNFADVFKHVVLLAIIRHLQQKSTAYCYLESHAGAPCYDLRAESALKTSEASLGIQKVWSQHWSDPLMNDYLQTVKHASVRNHGTACVVYPGSGVMAASTKRAQDRIVLQELALKPFTQLQRFFEKTAQVHCHNQDGYAGLKAFLPPPEKRGLVVIDPPYEDSQEWRHLKQALTAALKRWSYGIYAIWYPIKDRASIEKNLHALLAGVDQPVLRLECCPWPDDVPNRLNGSGLCILNPPWQLQQQITPLSFQLAKVFA